MKKYSRFLFLFSLLVFLGSENKAFAADPPKDTILLMNGDKIACEVVDTIYHHTKIKFQKKKKEKILVIDNEEIFAVVYKDGHENVVYEQDSLAGNYFTPAEVRMFIYGERDAQKYYRCPLATGSSVLVGFASGYVGSILSLIPPFAYSFILLVPKIKIKYKTVSNPEYLSSDTYLLGYEKVAKRKKLFRSLVGGIGGMVAGLYTFQLILQK
jgi:hypothetical protein